MTDESTSSALELISSEQPDKIHRGIEFFHEVLAGLPDADFRNAVDGICSLFYVDTIDHPELQPAIDLAVSALATAGVRVVPHLLRFMEGSDIKSHLHLAQTLGEIGPDAVPALREFIARTDDPYGRSFALFALGKIKDPAIHIALPEVVGSLLHPDREVRDSAARTLGKIAEVVPPGMLTERRRTEIFDALFRTLSDSQPALRAKGVRSLGKMVRADYLSSEQATRFEGAVRRILGEDKTHDWDRAFIVRREATEALTALKSRKA